MVKLYQLSPPLTWVEKHLTIYTLVFSWLCLDSKLGIYTLQKFVSACAFYLSSSLSFLLYFGLLPLRYISLPILFLSPFLFTLPLVFSLWFVFSSPFWHLCQRFYTFLKYLSKKLLWSMVICLRALCQLSNATSSDFN